MAKTIVVRIDKSKPRTFSCNGDASVILGGTVYNGPASVIGRGVVVPMGRYEVYRVGMALLMALPAAEWKINEIDQLRKLYAVVSVKG